MHRDPEAQVGGWTEESKLPFGNHQDKKIKDVPWTYLNWCAQVMNLRQPGLYRFLIQYIYPNKNGVVMDGSEPMPFGEYEGTPISEVPAKKLLNYWEMRDRIDKKYSRMIVYIERNWDYLEYEVKKMREKT